VADIVYLCGEDGNLRPFTMTSLPFFNPDGELIGVGNYATEARDHSTSTRLTPLTPGSTALPCASVRECPLSIRFASGSRFSAAYHVWQIVH